jgi:hypothetical protein
MAGNPTYMSPGWAQLYMPIVKGMPGSREVDAAASMQYTVQRR